MVIVDASIVIKWFLPEEGSTQARLLLEQEILGAPGLLVYELSNTLVCKHGLSLKEIQDILSYYFEIGIELFQLSSESIRRTIVLSREFGLTAYDACYVALAESLNTKLITADQKLVRKVKSLPFVFELGSY